MIEYITKILRLSEIIYDLKINKLLIQVYLEIIEDYFLKLAEMIHSLVNEIECWMNHRELVRSFFMIWNGKRRLELAKGLILSSMVALLAVPTLNVQKKGDIYQILINGKAVGTASGLEEAEEAVKEARLLVNAESQDLTYLDVDITFEKGSGKGKAIEQEKLITKVYDEMKENIVEDKTLAYTLKIGDYTVTLDSQESVLAVLEQTQAKYDVNDDFTVELVQKEKGEINALTTNVMSASIEQKDTVVVNKSSVLEEESQQETTLEESAETVDEGSVEATVKEEGAVTMAGVQEQQILSEDGVISIEFKEEIEVLPTYVSKGQITSVDSAVEDITKEKEENVIYEVVSGDCISVIANNNGMTVAEFLSINPEISVEEGIYVGDQVVIQVPKPELSVIRKEQQTYTESYEEEVIYVDNPDAYIGENTVLVEGSAGEREVTAMVVFEGDVETEREVLSERILVQAVPKKVSRGTKALPTYIKPITGGTFTSGYGARWGRTHKGVDWGCSTGTTVRAARAGVVTHAGWSNGYGYCVYINHGDGVVTKYAHLSKITVSSGQYVSQGDKIALSGNTGRSTGPHLHFEIVINGTAVNPLNYVSK